MKISQIMIGDVVTITDSAMGEYFGMSGEVIKRELWGSIDAPYYCYKVFFEFNKSSTWFYIGQIKK